MQARGWLTATVLFAVLAPGTGWAEGIEGRLSIAFQAGTQSEVAGDFMKGASGTLLGKPATFDSQRYRDVYAPDLRLQALFGFGLGERVELIARGTYYKAEGTAIQAGTFDGKDLFAFFEPYGATEEVGFEVGVRYYIAAAGRLKSYVAPVVGARVLSEVLVSYSIPDAGSSIQNVPFHEESTVPVFGLDVGFTFDLGEHVFIGVDTGLRYQGAPSSLEGLQGLAGINDADGRWTAPVMAQLGVRF
jgi:hypothetical protein